MTRDEAIRHKAAIYRREVIRYRIMKCLPVAALWLAALAFAIWALR